MSDKIDLETIERYQRLFVAPLVNAVEAKIEGMLQPMIREQAALRKDVGGLQDRTGKLEGSQKKALVGWGVFATALSLTGTALWGKIKSRLHM